MRKRASRSDIEPSKEDMAVHGLDFGLSRRTAVLIVALCALFFVMFLTSDYWMFRKPKDRYQHVKIGGDGPFLVSSDNILFEIGDGVMLTLTPRRVLESTTDISVVLDDNTIIDTIRSFTVHANSTKTIQIPIHSKQIAGHCVMSFKTTSKKAEIEKLFQLRIKIKVVHQILFGYLSRVIGWMYFVMWSCCYYPQIYQNWKRQSVVGFSFDYVSLNITGHICYFTFNSCMYFNSFIQKSFTLIHPKAELPVKTNDVFFSVHAVVMNIILIIQCFVLERGDQRISLPMMTFVGSLWFMVIVCLFGAIAEFLPWLQFIYYLAYIKVGTTPIKYTPQVYLHYRSKSTSGWAIHSVLLDVAGGVLSFLQMAIEAINNDDWDGELGNPGKLGLSALAMLYSTIFMIQHYILYPTGHTRTRKITDPPKTPTSDFDQKLHKFTESFVPARNSGKVFEL